LIATISTYHTVYTVQVDSSDKQCCIVFDTQINLYH